MRHLFRDQKGVVTLFSAIILLFFIIGLAVAISQLRTIGDFRSKAQTTSGLTVNATKQIRPFSKQMLGQAFVNWEHSWGKPFPNEVPGLAQAMREEGVGVIRYAGGLWANSVGWDRTTQKTPYTAWTKNGLTYYFHYGTDEMDSLNKFADAIGADVIIQVNIANNDPSMWADMVRYVNLEKGYNFKYWELGNEMDHDVDKGVTPDIYVARMKGYIDAMKDVDPSIHIIAGVPASAHDAPRQGWSDAVTEMSRYLSKSAPAISPKGRKPDDLSWHWYQACNSTNNADLANWQFAGLARNSWRNAYSRIWSEIAPQRIKTEIIQSNTIMHQGITELNFDACNYDNVTNGNHMSALWVSDVIGRLGYSGLDFATWYEGYGGQGYSTIYYDNPDRPTRLFVRPSYSAFYMYNKYFGDQYVESTSYDNAAISIFASTDSKDPGKLKLRITNISNAAITVPVNLTGFTASTGSVYTLKSNNPTDTSAASNTQSASTAINGVKLDGNNVAQSAAAIVPVSITINGNSFTYTFPAYSSTAIVLHSQSGSTLPSPTPTSTLSPSPTRTPSPTPSPSPSPTIRPSPSPSPTATPCVKVGDYDQDCDVDITDLSFLLGYYRAGDLKADLNKDGRISIADVSVFASNYGK